MNKMAVLLGFPYSVERELAGVLLAGLALVGTQPFYALLTVLARPLAVSFDSRQPEMCLLR